MSSDKELEGSETENQSSADSDILQKLLENRTIFLFEYIDKPVSTKICSYLLFLDNKDKKKEIKLFINSSGGDMECFFAIYDMMQFISAPIKTICIGEASSSAAELLAAGTPGKRCAMPNAQIMIHGVQMPEISGSKDDVEREVARYNLLNDRSIKMFAENTGKSIKQITNDIVRDKYLTAEQALEYGIIDKILLPKKK